MNELKKLVFSFGYALRGIGYAIATQRNFRIHLVALATVAVFGAMAGLSGTHWCMVLLCCMLVISLELVNTALEAACDKISTGRHPLLRHAKDAAAGAVLVSAMGSVAVAALLLFGENLYYLHIAKIYRLHRWVRYALPAGALAGIVFVFLPSLVQRKNRK